MSIDWITIAAQIVNFLVLVWLLKRFLYRPILDGIDAREREISERMSEAATIRTHAEETEADYKTQIAKLKAGREGVIEEAREVAENERAQLLTDAKTRLQREQAAREEERAQEAREYTAGLHAQGASALLALTRKALSDLSDETLEQRIIARAASHITGMAGDLSAAAGEVDTAVITTQSALPKKLCSQIEKELSAAMPHIGVQFLTDPDQSPGLSLRLGGAQLGWTVDSYMDGLAQILDTQEQAHAA